MRSGEIPESASSTPEEAAAAAAAKFGWMGEAGVAEDAEVVEDIVTRWIRARGGADVPPRRPE